eukprot:397414_1
MSTQLTKKPKLHISTTDQKDDEKTGDFMINITLKHNLYKLTTQFTFKESIRRGTFKLPTCFQELDEKATFVMFAEQMKAKIEKKMYLDPPEITDVFDVKFKKLQFVPDVYWQISTTSCKKTYILDNNNGDEKE